MQTKNIWKRNGNKDKEYSFNKKGVILKEQEVNQKGHTRWVQTGYITLNTDDE